MDTVARHFAAENARDVAATLATYTDDIMLDDVTHLLSPVSGKEAVGAVSTDILSAIPDVRLDWSGGRGRAGQGPVSAAHAPSKWVMPC